MHELRNSIPDPDVLLALEPEELAGVLLRCLRDRVAREDRAINPNNCVIELRHVDPYRPDSGYPHHRVREVQVAVSEAFAWLEAQAHLRLRLFFDSRPSRRAPDASILSGSFRKRRIAAA